VFFRAESTSGSGIQVVGSGAACCNSVVGAEWSVRPPGNATASRAKESGLRLRISRRVWGIGIILGLILVFVVGIVVWGLAQSNKPEYQQQISMPSQAGVQQYLVNLWLDPSSPQVGSNQLTVQVTSIIGTPTAIDNIDVKLAGPNGAPSKEFNGTLANDSSHPSQSFLIPVEFDAPGSWTITVEVHSGDLLPTATYTVNVNQP
jgi:hypothetical protein